jgi:hypothetical protein
MVTRRTPQGRLSWWLAHLLLEGDRSLAAAFIGAEERAALEREHGQWLRQLLRDHPDADVWTICRLASGDYSIVARPRCAADVRRARMNEPTHLREGE